MEYNILRYSQSVLVWKRMLFLFLKEERHQNWKGRSKTVILADYMTLYIENPKDATKNPLDLISEFRKAVGYKINKQKSVKFL